MNKEKLHEIISKSGNLAELRDFLAEINVADGAELFDSLEKDKAIHVFRLFPKDIAAEVFSHLDADKQAMIINELTDFEIKKVIDDLFIDDAVDFIEEMPANIVSRVLRNTSPEMRDSINLLLKYPENSAGSIMTTEYMDLKKSMTVGAAIAKIRATGIDKETLDNAYITNSQRVLEGVVSIRSLLLANDNDKIEDIMDTKVIAVQTGDDQENVSNLFMKYDYFCVPVVDTENRLVGIITVDDIIDVIQEENTEDFEIMAAMTPSEKPYLKTSVIKLAANRIPWLLFLMLSATLTALVITSFEDQLAAQTVLMSFVPMLMDTGGNAGSQSATLAIRGMALNEIKPNNFFTILRKECSVGLLSGTALGIVNFIRIVILGGKTMVALTVSITLMCTIVLANVIGGTLPLLAKILKADPALMASPLITTIVDTLSLIMFFNIARIILHL